jgi:transcriptional regulator with XRE-family HTH domain
MQGDAPNIGQRIARYRKAAGLTQPGLAKRAHISLSLLGKVEAGSKPATDKLLEALAPVLNVTADELARYAGMSRRRAPNPLHVAIDSVFAAMLRHDIPLTVAAAPRDLTELAAVVDNVTDLRACGAYAQLGRLLPGLIDELQWVAHDDHASRRGVAFRLLTRAYFAAHAMAYKFDRDPTLAERCIDWSAERTGDPMLMALAAWTRGHSLLTTGGPNLQAGLTLLSAARRELDGQLAKAGTEALSVYGALLLREAFMAARAGRAELARTRIAHAREMVERGARDVNTRSILTAGPVNSRIVETAVGHRAWRCQCGDRIGPRRPDPRRVLAGARGPPLRGLVCPVRLGGQA